MSEKLKPCPMCGSRFLIGQEPHDNWNIGGHFYLFHEYGPIGSDARKCIISVGRHFESEAEAIEAWNRRHQEQDQSSSKYERLLSK